MTGIDYIERLIEDIESSINIRGSVRSVSEQIALSATGHNDLKEFESALNAGNLDVHVDIVVQLIGKGLLTHVHGEKLDINLLLKELNDNKEAIVHNTDYILEGNMFSTSGDAPSDILVEQFDWIHMYSR